jgi:DNA-binding NtrC family response regulator
VPSFTERITHLDPRDTSFDPTILERLVSDLKQWNVNVLFLEKLLQKHRVSLNDEANQMAFEELSASSSDYFSWFDEYALKFCEKFEPFEEAYDGYLLFCELFLQDPTKDDNILATIKSQCALAEFNYVLDIYEDKPSYQRPLNALRKNIMKYLLEFYSKEYDYIDAPNYFWQALEQNQAAAHIDYFSEDSEYDEMMTALAELKEVELLKQYYRKQLKITGGNIKAAAKRIGLKENTFRSRMKKLGVGRRKEKN